MNKSFENELYDHGPTPFIGNLERLTKINPNYRTALWTGEKLQVTLMSIPVGGDIGAEIHADTDQLICIERGYAVVLMGKSQTELDHRQRAGAGFAVFVPAGTWHNVVNTGASPLKLFSVYAPPEHPHGTLQRTKKDAESEETY